MLTTVYPYDTLVSTEQLSTNGGNEMEQLISNCVNAYTLGLITAEELAGIIAKKYAKEWATLRKNGILLAYFTK